MTFAVVTLLHNNFDRKNHCPFLNAILVCSMKEIRRAKQLNFPTFNSKQTPSPPHLQTCTLAQIRFLKHTPNTCFLEDTLVHIYTSKLKDLHIYTHLLTSHTLRLLYCRWHATANNIDRRSNHEKSREYPKKLCVFFLQNETVNVRKIMRNM